jgi:hypothetical protein
MAAISRPLHAPAGLNSARPGGHFRSALLRATNYTKGEFSLLVGNHPLHFAEIAIADQRGRTQPAFPLLGLRAQHVTQAGMSPLHLAAGRLLEALRCAFVRFQFRHSSSESAAGRRPSAVSFNLLFNGSGIVDVIPSVPGEHLKPRD